MAEAYWAVTCPNCKLTLRVSPATSDDLLTQPPILSGAPEDTFEAPCGDCQNTYTFTRGQVWLETKE
jgi:hypothetical protein